MSGSKEIGRTGVEPSPIEMFRMFHVSKTKDDQPEEWSTGKANELYQEMEDERLLEEMIRDDGEEPLDDWGIYKEIVAKPKHGKIRGLGDTMEPPNELCASSSSKSCTNGSCLEREKEIGELKQEVGTLKDGLADMKQLVQALIANVAPSLSTSPISPATAAALTTKDTNGDTEARAP
ncbi:uncharacterized protein LOC126796977 [Argentina anserina]|uniref:uncharacterized protein LOC126796977 n=1 Tax=Argentina anserina TaxID=57926 RepID=UPI0021767A99|nr:uncharacterized protein LOC126796977 [Potentilla anserina]